MAVADNFTNIFRERRRFFALLLKLGWGVSAGLLESRGLPKIFCLISMLPIFIAMECRTRRALVLKVLPFLAAYCTTKSSFLLTISDISGLPFGKYSGAFALLAVLAAAGIMLLPLAAALSFYVGVRPSDVGKLRGAAYLSALWAGGEYLSGCLGFFSFPWLGVWAQADGALPLTLTANLLGCRFTSFIIMYFNGLAYIFCRSIKLRRWRPMVKCVAAFITVGGLVGIYGNSEILSLKAESAAGEKLTAAALQLDCEGREKSSMKPAQAAREYMRLAEKCTSADVIFLPETAVNAAFSATHAAFSQLVEFAEKSGKTVVTGCFYKDEARGEKYNAVIAVTPDGAADSRYCKSRLVPFGEFVPFAKNSLAACTAPCEPIDVGGVRIACGVCVESIYGDIFRGQVRQGEQLIFIPTNDSWFGSSFARRAHYIHAKMRAVENSRYTVRAGNCGISAIITPWGEEAAADRSREKGGVCAETALLSSKSLYTTLGDVFMLLPLTLAAMSGAASAKARFSRRM